MIQLLRKKMAHFLMMTWFKSEQKRLGRLKRQERLARGQPI
jgi:hypothetical protein